MADMQEIVSVEQVHRLFLILAVALPLLGLAGGALLGVRRKDLRRGIAQGLLLGILGPVNFALWLVYNSITDRLGLDTVKNLLVNLALFVTLGIATGIVVGIVMRRGDAGEPKESLAESPGES